MAAVKWPLRPLPTVARASVYAKFTHRQWQSHQIRSLRSSPCALQRQKPIARPRDPKQEHEHEQRLPSQASVRPSEPRCQSDQSQVGRNTQLANTLAHADTSDLVTEVHIPDDPDGVLPRDHPALSLLGNSSLVIQRQLEMMNVMLGFEQANRYIIMDGQGQTLGYIAEKDHGIGSAMARQMFRTHRSFTTHIFDRNEKEVLRIHRPFAYINSRIRIYDPVPPAGYKEMESSTDLQGVSRSSALDHGAIAQVSPLKLEEMRIIGEAQQQWAPLRRKYNLFSFRPLVAAPEDFDQPRIESGDTPNSGTTALTESKVPERAIEAGMAQFAHVNEPFLSWDFHLRDEQQNTVGSVNRSFGGFAREIFTDTGVYALRMDSAAQTVETDSTEYPEVKPAAMSLDQRAVMLATAVSIDFDYFSRHSHAGGGFMPLWIPMGGGTAAEGAGAAGAAGAAGVGEVGAVVGAGESATGVAGGVARGAAGIGAGEGAMAGAGTMAGYEAMQRGVYGQQGQSPTSQADSQSPQAANPPQGDEPIFNPDGQNFDQRAPGQGQGEETWSEDSWGGNDGTPPSNVGSGGEEGGGGAIVDAISDFFFGD